MRRYVAVAIGGFVLLVVIANVVTRLAPPVEETAAAQPTARPAATPTRAIQIVSAPRITPTTGWTRPSSGAEARVRAQSGNDRVPLADTSETLDRLARLAGAKDTAGWNSLMAARGFWVANNTRVLVLGHGLEETEVRVLEGEHSGRSGWAIPQNVWP